MFLASLRNPLFDLELAALDAAEVAVDDADVGLLADDRVALRMAERVLYFPAFARTIRSNMPSCIALGLDAFPPALLLRANDVIE